MFKLLIFNDSTDFVNFYIQNFQIRKNKIMIQVLADAGQKLSLGRYAHFRYASA